MGYKVEKSRLYRYLIIDSFGDGKDELLELLAQKYYIINTTTIGDTIHHVLEKVEYDYEENQS